MKKLALFLVLGCMVNLLFAKTAYEENFSSYTTGSELVGNVSGWEFFSTFEGSSTVVDDAPGFAGKALKLSKTTTGAEDYDMILTPTFDMSTTDPLRTLIRVSATMIPSSETDLMALYSSTMNRFAYLHCNRKTGVISSYPAGATLDTLHKDNTPNEISLLWDNLDNTIREITCNGATQACHIAMSGTDYSQPVRMRLSTQFGTQVSGAVTYYSNLLVKEEPRSASPQLFTPKTYLNLKKAAISRLSIYNSAASGEINYTVSKPADAAWLTVTPSSGTLSDEAVLSFSASGDDAYKRTQVTISGNSGAAGELKINVYWQNGNIFYYEDFEEPLMKEGDLQNQGGWLVRGAYCDSGNKALIEKPTFSSGQCMHAYRATGFDGIRRGGEASSPSIEGCPSLALVKVSCKFYWDSSSDAQSIYLATPYSAKPFCLKIRRDGNRFYLYQMKDGSYTPPLSGYYWPMDEWINFSYTLDFQSQKGVSVQFNDDVGDISTLTFYGDGQYKSLTGLSFCTDKASGAPSDWDSKFYFDDITCEFIPRGDEPILALSDTAIHTGLTGTNATLTLVNSGAGSITYSASLINSAPWLTLSNTSGTFEDEAQIGLNIKREGLANDYYRAVIAISCGELGTTNVLVTAASGKTIYFEDFEEPFMQKGDLQNQDRWTVRDGAYCRDVNEAYVENFDYTGCMHVLRALGYDGIRNSHIAGCPPDQMVKFSMKIYWSDETEAQNIYLATPYGKKPFSMKIRKNDDGTFSLYQMMDGSFAPPLQGYTWSMNEWIPLSFTLDFRSQCGVSLQIGDDVAGITGLTLYGNGSYHILEGFSFCTDGSGTEFDSKFYFDDLKMEIVERDPDPIMSVAASKITIGFESNTGDLTVSNLGGGSFAWTASLPEDPFWVSLVEESGTCEEESTVRVLLDRTVMENDYYRTILHLDAGIYGSTDIFINACSGNTFYKEDFEYPFMQVGDLQGQDGWVVRNSGYCRDVNRCFVTNGLPFTDSACLHAAVSKGIDGTTKDHVPNCPNDSRVKISLDVYWDADSPCSAVYLACPTYRKPMTLKIENKGDGTFGVRGMQDDKFKVMIGKTWSMNEWVPISYTMDFRTQTGVELTIGDVTESITQVELYSSYRRYEGFSFCTDGEDEMDALVYFDNLRFEVVPREDKPKPVIQGGIILGNEDSTTVNVLNYGTEYNYTVKMLELSDNISVTPASGSVKDSGELTVTVNREGLIDSFYRARLLYSYTDGVNSGVLTTLVSFAVGGWYYGTDFTHPYFYYGSLNGQESWSANSEEVSIAYLEGENTIVFPYACSTELLATVPNGAAFTFCGRVYSAELADDSYLRIGTIDGSGYLPIYISREGNPRELQIGYFQGNTWTPVATAPFGEWVDFSFTMDTDITIASLKQLTFGDFVTNFVDGDVPLNPRYDGEQIKKFSINCYDVANPAGMYLSRIIIRDPEVPEPAVIGIFLMLAALFLKRR